GDHAALAHGPRGHARGAGAPAGGGGLPLRSPSTGRGHARRAGAHGGGAAPALLHRRQAVGAARPGEADGGGGGLAPHRRRGRGGRAEGRLAGRSGEDRRLAGTALPRLVPPERTRGPCPLAELRRLGAAPRDMKRVLGRMIDARLLTVEGGGEADATVELVHE